MTLSLCLLAAPALADEPPAKALPPLPAYGGEVPEFMQLPIPTERRHGFVLGLNAGAGLVSARATPKAFAKRTDAYLVDLGTFVAPMGTLLLGGAISDQLAIEFSLGLGSQKHDGVTLSSRAFGMRFETWPLFQIGGVFRDLGISLDVGTGSATFKRGADTVAEAGTFSLVGASAFYDGFRFWRLNAGPLIAFDYRSSDTYSQSTLWLGFRTALYGGP